MKKLADEEAMFTVDGTFNPSNYSFLRKFLRFRIASAIGVELIELSSSKHQYTHSSNERSKSNNELSSVKKVNVNPIKERFPSTSNDDTREEKHYYLGDPDSRTKKQTPSREIEEHSDYRIKSETHLQGGTYNGLDDFDLDVMGTKRANESKGTPRLINFSLNSNIKQSPIRDTSEARQDLWLAAGGFSGLGESKIDYLTLQETKRLEYENGHNKTLTDREKEGWKRDLPPQVPVPKKKHDETEDYHFVETGISQYVHHGENNNGSGRTKTNDFDLKLEEIDREIENIETSMLRFDRSHMNDSREELPFLSKLEPMRKPSPPSQKPSGFESNEFRSKSGYFNGGIGYRQILQGENQVETSHFLSFRPQDLGIQNHNSLTNSNHQTNDDKMILMNLKIDCISLTIHKGDNSSKIAKRYFEKAGICPTKKEFSTLTQMITEKVNKKIDYLEKFFRRSIATKEVDNNKPKMINIDLANKENHHPNIQQAIPIQPQNKPQIRRSPITKYTSNSSLANDDISVNEEKSYIRKMNKAPSQLPNPTLKKPKMSFNSNGSNSIDINVKKDDNPKELARLILLKRGMGLANLDRLAESIKEFQQATYFSKKR